MFRKMVSITLTVSFVAVASSGLLMLVNGGFAFQLRIHPVHNTFGALMIISGLAHLGLNFKPLKTYVRLRPIWILALVLTALLTLAYAAGLGRELDPELMEKLSELEASAPQ